jgi:hypothetical protein
MMAKCRTNHRGEERMNIGIWVKKLLSVSLVGGYVCMYPTASHLQGLLTTGSRVHDGLEICGDGDYPK